MVAPDREGMTETETRAGEGTWGGPSVSRRQVLVASTILATAGPWLPAAVHAAPAASAGEPFSDGLFFDDGFGWCDGPSAGSPRVDREA